MNFGGILYHSARVRKKQTLTILFPVIIIIIINLHLYSAIPTKKFNVLNLCWRLPQTDTNTVFNPVPPRQSNVRIDKNVACLRALFSQWGRRNGIKRLNLGRKWHLGTHTHRFKTLGIKSVQVNDFVQDQTVYFTLYKYKHVIRKKKHGWLIPSWIINEYKGFKLCHFVFQKQCFDEKMDKMDEVFKSELRTIKEQHERLRVDLVPKLPDNHL
jgi:hypothetical protein